MLGREEWHDLHFVDHYLNTNKQDGLQIYVLLNNSILSLLHVHHVPTATSLCTPAKWRLILEIPLYINR